VALTYQPRRERQGDKNTQTNENINLFHFRKVTLNKVLGLLIFHRVHVIYEFLNCHAQQGRPTRQASGTTFREATQSIAVH
jgi:hypothetical protein